MPETVELPTRYSYPDRGTVVAILVALLVVTLFVAVAVDRRSDYLHAFFTAFFLILSVVPVSLNVLFLRSDIILTDGTVSMSLFGWNWKTIRWENVTSVSITPLRSTAYRSNIKAYTINQLARRTFYFLPKGPVIFKSDIVEVGTLLRQLSVIAKRRAIPITLLVKGSDEPTLELF